MAAQPKTPDALAAETGFHDWALATAATAEQTLDRLLPVAHAPAKRLVEAMRYSCLGGGKRVRAMLVTGAGMVSHAPPERLQVLAAAVEMIHAYSLIHDDLPCMDDDVLRRGKPTCHVQFDEATAMLAGDALQARAFELLGEHVLADSPPTQLKMLARFALACGAAGMAGGQAIDLANTGRAISLAELEHMHSLKTGALIAASVELGALAGRPFTAEAMTRLITYANAIGLAFQVVDDVLDESAATETLGKTAGKDKEQGKTTYVTLMGLAGARRFADELLQKAHAALLPFGDSAVRLHQLASFVVERSH
jgi:farnesyl diphosphate synthase